MRCNGTFNHQIRRALIEDDLREVNRELEYRRGRHPNFNGRVNEAMIKKLEARMPELVNARLCAHEWDGATRQTCKHCGYQPKPTPVFNPRPPRIQNPENPE